MFGVRKMASQHGGSDVWQLSCLPTTLGSYLYLHIARKESTAYAIYTRKTIPQTPTTTLGPVSKNKR